MSSAPSPHTHPAPAWQTTLDAHLDYLRVQKRLAERTLVNYSEAFARLSAAMSRDQVPDLGAVKPHHIRGWVARLHGQGQGPRSIALTLSAWRGLWRWLGREGLVSLNPVEGIKAPKAPKPLPKALSVDDAVALAEYAARATPQPAASDAAATRQDTEAPWLQARDHAIVELLYGCGLRSGELLGLDVAAGPHAQGWLDLHGGEAHVLGKGSKRRMVPIGAAAMKALQRWLSLRATLTPPQDDALFLGRQGSRLTAAQLRARLKQLARDAGLPTHVHPHMLRHSFASHILQSSGDLRAVQELLGHAHITTTQIYTKLDFQHLAKVYDAAHPRAKRK